MTFSIEQYLLENKLINSEYKLLESKNIPINPEWGLGPYYWDETKIYLCTLIHFFKEKGVLDNIKIYLESSDEYRYRVYIDLLDKKNYYMDFNWDLVLETINFLIPSMAGSNVSYLADMLIVNN